VDLRIQYVNTADGVSIAYTEMGDGYPVIHLPGPPFTHVQHEMRMPSYFDNNKLIAEQFRCIRFDSRGTGLSEREISEPSLEAYCQDMEAVADRLGLESFAILGTQAGGLIAMRYAIDHPDRVSHLVLWDAYPSGGGYREIPQVRAFLAMMENDYEMFTETLASVMFGWTAGDSARDYAAYLRECASSSDARRFFDALNDLDLTDELESIKQPTLVVHHKSIPLPDLATARLLTSRIPNSHLVLLEGTWNVPGDDHDVLRAAFRELIGGPAPVAVPAAPVPSGLATILFTDVEGSSIYTDRLGDLAAREVLRDHERVTREALAVYGGSEVKSMGDGFMAWFGSASRALECAIAIQRNMERGSGGLDRPVRVRIGLNAGEPIAEDDDLFGHAVIVAARIAAQANGGEILVSDVVRQLVAGKGFMFADRGEHALKGFEDPVRVYEVRWGE
jgi:class 3 adenylate cyclase